MNREEYLKDRLEDQINWYDSKSSSNQKSFKWLQISIIVFSAVIPLLTGYITPETLYFKDIIALIGLIVVVLTGFLSLGKHHENWLEYRTTCESLKHEKYLFLTKTLYVVRVFWTQRIKI